MICDVHVHFFSPGFFDGLGAQIERAFAATLEPMELLVPFSAGGTLSELHAIAGDLERDERPDGVLVQARIPRALTHRFEAFSTNGSANGARGSARAPGAGAKPAGA